MAGNMHSGKTKDEISKIGAAAKGFADDSVAVAEKAIDLASNKVNELSKFGRERPLLAMTVAFGAGFIFAKLFAR